MSRFYREAIEISGFEEFPPAAKGTGDIQTKDEFGAHVSHTTARQALPVSKRGASPCIEDNFAGKVYTWM